MTHRFVRAARLRQSLFVLAASTFLIGAHAASLELSDCSILSGKKSPAAYKKWAADNQRRADAGEQDAIRLRAAVASNRLACLEEEVTGDEGWGVIVTTGSGADAVSETSGPTGIPHIAKNPVAFKALKDSVKYTHEAGAFDVAYKSMAAQTVARYAAALPELVDQGYADAAGAYAFDCILKRKVGHRTPANACPMVRPARAQLLPKVAPARRAVLDAEGEAWARQLPN